jgi:hypothetical protein
MVWLIAIVVCIVLAVVFGYISLGSSKGDAIKGTKNLDAYDGIGMSATPVGCPNEFALCDYHMASSANSVYGGITAKDYVYSESLAKAIKAGARLVDIHVYSVNKKAVVGYADTSGRMVSWNVVPLEECCIAVANTAFSPDTVGSKHPFVLSLMFHTSSVDFMTMSAEILKSTLRKFMLSSEYSYCRRDLAIEPICNLMDKLIVISGKETDGSPMAEFVNMKWGGSNLRRMTYTQASQPFAPEEDTEFNRRKITLVVPDENGGDLTNKNAEVCFGYGCQWVAMNYGSVGGSAMAEYTGKFLESPFVLKPEPLRHKITPEPETIPQDPNLYLGPKSIDTPIVQATIRPVQSPKTVSK